MADRKFTTYLNIEEDRRVAANLARMEQRAGASLNRISRTAAAASNGMLGGTSRGQDAAGVNALASAERRRAEVLARVVTEQNRAALAAERHAGGMLREGKAADTAAKGMTRFERSLRLAATAATVAQGPLGPIAGRLSAIGAAVSQLSGIPLGLVGAGAALAGFTRYAAQVQDLKSKLYPLYDSQVKVNQAWRESIRIANTARVNLEPVIDLYSRLTLAGRSFGLEQERISRMTEIASKAARLSGGTQVSQDAGLYQFAQGIGSGTLAGDELKSIRENTLRLAKAIADGLGVPIAKLKELGKAGELTPKVVAEALEKSAHQIDVEMSRLPVTISQGTAKLQTSFYSMIDNTEKATGVVGAFSSGLVFLADNLEITAKAGFYLVSSIAAYKASNIGATVLKDAAAWQANRVAIAATANEAVRAAQVQRRASAERIVALRQERAAVQAQLALDRQARTEAIARASAARQQADGRQNIWNGAQWREYRDAVNAATIADTNYNATQARLRGTMRLLRAEVAAMSGATTEYRRAVITARAAASSFGATVKAAAASVNWVGVALAVAIPLLIEFAFRESAAAAAADELAKTQESLARVLDFSTGKIRDQTQALQELELAQLRTGIAKSSADLRKSRISFRARAAGTPITPGGALPGAQVTFVNDPQIKRIIDAYDPSKPGSNIDATIKKLGEYGRKNPAAQKAVDDALRRAMDVRDLNEVLAQKVSARDILSGKGTAEDWRRAQGNFTGEDIAATKGMAAAEKELGSARGGTNKATDEAAKLERELREARERTDKRVDTLARYDEAPKAIDRARKDIRELQQLVGQAMELRDEFGNALIGKDGNAQTGLYTQEMADADAERIEYGVRQPIRDAILEQERGLDIQKLRLDGYDLEADALEQALQLQDQIGALGRDDLETLIDNARYQQEINDQLESRQRIMGLILDSANQARDATVEMLVSLGKGQNPLKAVEKFGSRLADNVLQVKARQLTEKLFAGADAKLRELVTGSSGVDRAADILKANIKSAADSVTPVIAANDKLASATEYAADRITTAADSIGATGGISGLAVPGVAPVSPTQSAKAAIDAIAGSSALLSLVGAAAGAANSRLQGGIQGLGGVNEIVVTARRATGSSGLGAGDGMSAVLQQMGANLSDMLGLGSGASQLISQVAGAIPEYAMMVAASNMIGSAISELTGLKYSKTAGSLFGALGGIVGGFFKKAHQTYADFGEGAPGEFSLGGGDKYTGEANSLGGAVMQGLTSITDALDATLGSFSLKIGVRDGQYIVDPTGDANFKKGVKFGDDQQAAIAFAIQDAIQDGAIQGISQASLNILKAGKDLQRSIEKAVKIESIPKLLMQMKDPVRYAVQELNDEFSELIGYLKEGSATSQQYADAEELYNLKRKEIMEQLAAQSTDIIQQYLDEIRGGSSSPFNARTTYNNARTKFLSYQADIAAGKTVDSNDLVNAARDYQNASQALNGSSTAFFSDFGQIQSLLEAAKANAEAGVSGAGNLPSPFDDAYVQQMIGATNNQTNIIAGKLDQLILLNGGTPSQTPAPSTIGMLPDSQSDYDRAAAYALANGYR